MTDPVSAELVPLPTRWIVDDGASAAAVADALAVIPTQARSDAELLALWLHGRAAHTQRAYQRAVGALPPFRAEAPAGGDPGRPAGFAAALEAEGLAPASRRLTLAAVKSLLAFGQRVGYLRFDVGAAVKLPPVRTPWPSASSTGRPCCACSTGSLRPQPGPAAAAVRRGAAGLGGLRPALARPPAAGRRRAGDGLRQGGQDAGGAAVPGDLAGAAGPPGRHGGRGGWRRTVDGTADASGGAGRAGVPEPGAGGRSTSPRPGASCRPRPPGWGCRPGRAGCRRTGCATPTPPTRWSTATPRSTWCRLPSGTPAWPPRVSTCTRARRTARRATSACKRPSATGRGAARASRRGRTPPARVGRPPPVEAVGGADHPTTLAPRHVPGRSLRDGFRTRSGPCSGRPRRRASGGSQKGAFSGVPGGASAAPGKERRRRSPTLWHALRLPPLDRVSAPPGPAPGACGGRPRRAVAAGGARDVVAPEPR